MNEITTDARRILEDLELAEIDPLVVLHVKNGLAAIAERIRGMRGTGTGAVLVLRDDVVRLVDPEAKP